MDQLEGKVAVVTGAGSGIGRGIARSLVDSGCHVVIADIDERAAQAVAVELARPSVRAEAVRLDVADRGAVEAVADWAWDRFGHVDVLANNAGVFPGITPGIEIDENNARWVLEVNLMGVWYGFAAFGRRFMDQGTPAHILTTGSEHSVGMAHTGAAFYTASKHATLALCDVLRHELPEFIGISILCPGAVRTKLSNSAAHRHERFGGPAAPVPAMEVGMDPDEIGRRAVDGMRRGEFYIVPHPHVRELVEERADEALASFDTQAARYPRVDVLATRNRFSIHLLSGHG